LKAIQQRVFILSALSCIGILISILLFVKNTPVFQIDWNSFVVFVFPLSVLLLGLSIGEYKKCIFAKLIMENKIIHIQAAKIEQKSKNISISTAPIWGTEIFISCFGILIGSRVIKFNIDRIHLKKVEIGNDFICIVYSKNENNNTIRLLHGIMEKQELLSIINKFRHETGIIPTVVD